MVEERGKDMESFIESEKKFLWSQALYITGKTEDAEDLLQETLMKAFKGFSDFNRDTNFRAWARKIMINTHINKEKHRTTKTQPMEDSYLNRENVFLDDPPNASCMDNPEYNFFQNHINEEIMEAFDSLPEKYKSVFSLFHFNGYRYDEISRTVNVPVGTVKSKIHRARQYLTEKVRSMHHAGNETQ